MAFLIQFFSFNYRSFLKFFSKYISIRNQVDVARVVPGHLLLAMTLHVLDNTVKHRRVKRPPHFLMNWSNNAIFTQLDANTRQSSH